VSGLGTSVDGRGAVVTYGRVVMQLDTQSSWRGHRGGLDNGPWHQIELVLSW
jgi:hypothetical protein